MTKRKEKTLTEKDIRSLISCITEKPDEFGFEVYVITKNEPKLRKMGFVETGTDNLLQKLKKSILKILDEKYNSNDVEYVSVDRIADEQRKIYMIPTSERYDPMSMLRSTPGFFCKNDYNEAAGIVFSVRQGEKQLWAYQHLWSIMVPNKTGKGNMARLISNNTGDVFEEITDPILTFAEKIDFLIVSDYIITSDYKLLQRFFGFHEYIRMRADKAISAIEEKEIVENVEKLRDYVQRGNGKPKYAKKMMRITDSKVLKMEPDKLWNNIHRSARWNGKIKEKEGKFILDTYEQVENLIDLLDERYTRSDITGEEYDTDVKKLAESVMEKRA